MNKRQAIRIMTNSARLYKENLEDKKVLFLYGIPREINEQLHTREKELNCLEYYEVVFHRSNFLHLTGVHINPGKLKSSIQFYEKCIGNRLAEDDFEFSKDGSSIQKLEILEHMMSIKKNVAMLGEFTNKGPKLYSEKVAGGVCGCIGFVKDRKSKLNVPNTLLKKDIRDVTSSPKKKIYAVFDKTYMDDKYSNVVKLDKSIDINEIYFSKEIENILKRSSS